MEVGRYLWRYIESLYENVLPSFFVVSTTTTTTITTGFKRKKPEVMCQSRPWVQIPLYLPT